MIEALNLKHKPYKTNTMAALQKVVVQWKMNRQTRRALLALEDWQLDDIGIERQAANSEGRKKFWQ